MGRGGGLGAGAGEGQGPAHQSEAASVLHTLVRLGGGVDGGGWGWGEIGEGERGVSLTTSQCQLTLMNSEQDGTGWKEVRVL